MKKTLIFFLAFFLLCNLAAPFPKGNIENPEVSWNLTIGDISTDLVRADVNEDGEKETIFGVGNVLYAQNGNETLWRSFLGSDMNRETTPRVLEFSSSKGKELLVGAGENVYLLNSTGGTIWRNHLSSVITCPPVKVKGNGENMVFLTTNYPVLLDNKGEITNTNEDIEARNIIKYGGSEETLLTGIEEIKSLEIPGLSTRWSKEGAVNSGFVVLERKGENAVIFRDLDGNVVALKPSGNVLWRTELNLEFYMGEYPSPGLADIDEDGNKEVLVSGYSDANFYMLNSNNGKIEKIIKASRRLSEPQIADIDGDGELEAISSYLGGDKIYSFDSEGIDWRMKTDSVIKTSPLIVTSGENSNAKVIYGTSEGLYSIENGENVPPDAFFTVSRNKAIFGDKILFNASESKDQDSLSDLRYRWNFESDTPETTGWTDREAINHTYREPGNYTVTLKVRDSQGGEGNYSREISVFSTNKAPEAQFTMSRRRGTIDTKFRFTATPKDREDSFSELQVRWNFGEDGDWDTEYRRKRVAEHEYKSTGEYEVEMQVKDSKGSTDTERKKIEVKENLDGSRGSDEGSGNSGESEENGNSEETGDSGSEESNRGSTQPDQSGEIPWVYIAVAIGLVLTLLFVIIVKTEKEQSPQPQNYRY